VTKVLIVEDDKFFAALLKRSLEREEICVGLASTVEDGLDQAQSGNFEVVLTDLYLGSSTALELTEQLRRLNPHLPVVIMTAKHTTETAIEATKHGAYDYFPKPDAFDFEEQAQLSWRWVIELSDLIEAAAANHRLTAKVRLPDDTVFLDARQTSDRMVGRSRAMQEVFKAIGRAAATDLTVLIRGETGTGKELAARAVYSHSSRSKQPFVVINSAAIPENLLESELFGHEKGAFTGAHARRVGRFEQANSGTLFLDEIGDMSSPLQRKLLRVLQEKTIERVGGKETIPVDVRVIAATHRNLESALQETEFRADLYYRPNVAAIVLPALRQMTEDIPDLVSYFLSRHSVEFGLGDPIITPEAIQLLREEAWPGNVRQLRNVLRKGLLLSRGLAISRDVLREALAQMNPPPPAVDQTFSEYVHQLLQRAKGGGIENVRETVFETADRELYAQAIHRAAGDQSKAARWLGISRPTMLEKLRKFGLHPTEHSKTPAI
jgi:DNA-binding NtrC family response regulator